MVEETALVLGPTEAFANKLSFECDALPYTKAIEVLGKARLPLLVDHEHKLNHSSI